MTGSRRGVGLTPMETRRDVIVTIMLPPGMPWDNIEATLRAAAPGAGAAAGAGGASERARNPQAGVCSSVALTETGARTPGAIRR